MIEITWKYDPEWAGREAILHSPDAAQHALETGNAAFAALGSGAGQAARLVLHVSADDMGLPANAGQPIQQTPFAAMLSCADARVPIELIFGQQANDLFVVRVAGNVLGTECLGSIDYAVSHMPTLKLLAVIGHTGCGAVTAAVEASLSPEAYMDLAANPPLRSIIDSLMAPVRLASGMLARVHGDAVPQKPGYKPALVELTIALNASMTAAVLHRTYAQQPDAALSATFAVYNIANRQAGLPLDKSADAAGWRAGLQAAPVDAQAVIRLAREMAGGRFITTLLDTAPNIPVHKESH